MHGQVRVIYGNNNVKVNIKAIEPVLGVSLKYMQCNNGTRKKKLKCKSENFRHCSNSSKKKFNRYGN